MDFGRVSKAGRLLRTAFRPVTGKAADKRVTPRMVGHLMKVMQSDTTGAHGRHTVTHGDLSLLDGFEFNSRAPLPGTLLARWSVMIDGIGGEWTVLIPHWCPGPG